MEEEFGYCECMCKGSTIVSVHSGDTVKCMAIMYSVVNAPSAKYWYFRASLNQYNDYVFRFLMKRAFNQVPTCLIYKMSGCREEEWKNGSGQQLFFWQCSGHNANNKTKFLHQIFLKRTYIWKNNNKILWEAITTLHYLVMSRSKSSGNFGYTNICMTLLSGLYL